MDELTLNRVTKSVEHDQTARMCMQILLYSFRKLIHGRGRQDTGHAYP